MHFFASKPFPHEILPIEPIFSFNMFFLDFNFDLALRSCTVFFINFWYFVKIFLFNLQAFIFYYVDLVD